MSAKTQQMHLQLDTGPCCDSAAVPEPDYQAAVDSTRGLTFSKRLLQSQPATYAPPECAGDAVPTAFCAPCKSPPEQAAHEVTSKTVDVIQAKIVVCLSLADSGEVTALTLRLCVGSSDCRYGSDVCSLNALHIVQNGACNMLNSAEQSHARRACEQEKVQIE